MDLPVCADCGCRAHLDAEGRCAVCVFRMPHNAGPHLVVQEMDRARERFGRFSSPHEAYGVLLEEVDELFDEIKGRAYNRDLRMVAEAIQVAAVALRFVVEHLEQNPDVCRALTIREEPTVQEARG